MKVTRSELDAAIDEYAMAFADQTIELVRRSKLYKLTDRDYIETEVETKKALAVVNELLNKLGIVD